MRNSLPLATWFGDNRRQVHGISIVCPSLKDGVSLLASQPYSELSPLPADYEIPRSELSESRISKTCFEFSEEALERLVLPLREVPNQL